MLTDWRNGLCMQCIIAIRWAVRQPSLMTSMAIAKTPIELSVFFQNMWSCVTCVWVSHCPHLCLERNELLYYHLSYLMGWNSKSNSENCFLVPTTNIKRRLEHKKHHLLNLHLCSISGSASMYQSVSLSNFICTYRFYFMPIILQNVRYNTIGWSSVVYYWNPLLVVLKFFIFTAITSFSCQFLINQAILYTSNVFISIL